jgi:hypothetical protein
MAAPAPAPAPAPLSPRAVQEQVRMAQAAKEAAWADYLRRNEPTLNQLVAATVTYFNAIQWQADGWGVWRCGSSVNIIEQERLADGQIKYEFCVPVNDLPHIDHDTLVAVKPMLATVYGQKGWRVPTVASHRRGDGMRLLGVTIVSEHKQEQ